MLRPTGGRRLPENVLDIQPRTAFDQKSDDPTMASQGGLMQRGRMRMTWAVSAGIFARVQQQSHDFDMSKLRSQGQRELTSLAVSMRKEPAAIVGTSQSRGYGQINTSATRKQGADGVVLAMQGSCMEGGVGIGALIAKEID